jgi:rare lipoprotein A
MASGLLPRPAFFRPALALLAWPLLACAQAPEPVDLGRGSATYYRPDFRGSTASGEPYHPDLLTAAHPALPFGTWLRVSYPASSRSVIVRINDRSPFVGGPLLQVSRAAAEQLGLPQDRAAEVLLTLLPTPSAPNPLPPPLTPVSGTAPTVAATAAAAPASSAAPPAAAATAPATPLPKKPAAVIRPVLRVQFGAFHDLESASRAQRELRGLEIDTVIYRRDQPGPGEPMFRIVTSGGFSERTAADRWLAYVQSSTGRYGDAYVTP